MFNSVFASFSIVFVFLSSTFPVFSIVIPNATFLTFTVNDTDTVSPTGTSTVHVLHSFPSALVSTVGVPSALTNSVPVGT